MVYGARNDAGHRGTDFYANTQKVDSFHQYYNTKYPINHIRIKRIIAIAMNFVNYIFCYNIKIV